MDFIDVEINNRLKEVYSTTVFESELRGPWYRAAVRVLRTSTPRGLGLTNLEFIALAEKVTLNKPLSGFEVAAINNLIEDTSAKAMDYNMSEYKTALEVAAETIQLWNVQFQGVNEKIIAEIGTKYNEEMKRQKERATNGLKPVKGEA